MINKTWENITLSNSDNSSWLRYLKDNNSVDEIDEINNNGTLEELLILFKDNYLLWISGITIFLTIGAGLWIVRKHKKNPIILESSIEEKSTFLQENRKRATIRRVGTKVSMAIKNDPISNRSLLLSGKSLVPFSATTIAEINKPGKSTPIKKNVTFGNVAIKDENGTISFYDLKPTPEVMPEKSAAATYNLIDRADSFTDITRELIKLSESLVFVEEEKHLLVSSI